MPSSKLNRVTMRAAHPASRKGLLWAAACLVAALTTCGAGGAAQAASPSPAAASSTSLIREASDYGWRRWIRSRVYSAEDAAKYGLHPDANWRKKSSDLPLVVLVHGFNSDGARNRAVLTPAIKAGYPCAQFSYPNDHTLSESAALMSRELRDFAKRHPKRRIAIVAHSMGGLIARACIEDPRLDPGVVDRLIMIATPNYGTEVAHVAVATDVWEHWLGRARGGCWARWRDSVVDGLGEAADDLVPDSPFLTQLNARRRNADVQYAIFLGTAAAVEEEEMSWIRGAVRNTGGRLPGVRTAAGKLDRWLGGMDELVEGKGDGIVAVERGRLEGVDDVLVLPFGHLSVTGDDDEAPVRRVRQELLARLR